MGQGTFLSLTDKIIVFVRSSNSSANQWHQLERYPIILVCLVAGRDIGYSWQLIWHLTRISKGCIFQFRALPQVKTVIPSEGLNARKGRGIPSQWNAAAGWLNHEAIKWRVCLGLACTLISKYSNFIQIAWPFLMMSGLSRAQAFSLVVSQLGMFRGKFGNFENVRRLNITDR